MPLDNTAPPGAAVTVAASDEAATPPTQATQPTRQESALTDLIASFRTELVDMRREFRNKLAVKPDSGAPITPTASGNNAAPPAWDPMAVLAFRDAIDEAGVIVTVPQRKMLEKLFRAESGVSDPVSWVREQADTLGWKKPAAPLTQPASAAPHVPVKPPDTPPPTGTVAGEPNIPDDPMLVPQSVVDSWTPAEARAHYDRWKTRNGSFRHPFADAREAQARGTEDLARASAALRKVLSGQK